MKQYDECSQKLALELFLRDYTPKQDGFRDRIVKGMLANVENDGIVYEVTKRYGQPMWNLGLNNSEKSNSTLFVPISQPGIDSVTAVIVFMQKPGADSISFRILNNQNPDTLITDFLLHCQTCIYGKGYGYTRRTKSHTNTKDYTITIKQCWDVFTGNLTVQTYSYSFCIWDVKELPTLGDDGSGGGNSGTFPDLGNGGDSSGDGNGGDGDLGDITDGNTATTETDCSRLMLFEELQEIKATRESIASREHCATSKILNKTTNLLYEVDPCMSAGTYAEYTLRMQSIQFRSVSEITDSRLYEETMHAYQDIFYGGLSKYGPRKDGYTNMEFEAKLMQAIYCIETGIEYDAILNRYFKSQDWTDFRNWIYYYLDNGTDNTFWEKYNYFIKIFNDKDPTYRGYISDSFPKMLAIDNLINGCPKL